MATEYLYGTYGQIADSVVQAVADISTAALYVGTAPVNLIRGYANAGIINTPVKLTNNVNAQKTIGFANDWDKYTLSEVIAAHFANPKGNVGPVYVINVLNPDIHRKASPTSVTLNFVNGAVSFESEDIILDTLALAGKAEGTDYTVNYSFTTGKVTIISADEDNPIEGAVAATYYEVDTSTIDEDTIIGTKTESGTYTGLQAAELVYQTYNTVINLFAAPKWSGIKNVYKALCAAATKLNGHWDGFVYADIPLEYTETTTTIEYTYNAVSNPDLGDNPSDSSWYEVSSTAYTPSEDTRVNTSKTYATVEASEGNPTEDPATEGFYERSGATAPYTYTLSEDTTVDSGKTYYTVTATTVTPDTGDNPFEEGWFEEDGEDYTASTDTMVDSTKTYYTRTGTPHTVTEDKVVDTINKAIAYKSSKTMTSERSKVFWPMANGTDGNKYHLSTLAIVETMRLDGSHDGVPMETCGNKTIPANDQYFGASASNAGYSVDDANNLCANGIDTLVYWGDAWKLWGDHTAAYLYGSTDIDPRVIFDVSMRMLFFLTNRFQRTWAGTVDKPFTKQLKDTILVREQERLDALVVMGALIGKPTITFEEAYNPIDDIRNGNFRWDIAVTPTPPMKSASAYVAYTDAGFSAYFD